jgi:hypothetical protein
MISKTGKQWIEAAKLLGKEPSALVRCPECGKANLKVEDILHACVQLNVNCVT